MRSAAGFLKQVLRVETRTRVGRSLRGLLAGGTGATRSRQVVGRDDVAVEKELARDWPG